MVRLILLYKMEKLASRGLGYSHFVEKLSFAGMTQSLIGGAHFVLQNGRAHFVETWRLSF